MSERLELTAELLRSLLHYDPETGVFTRLKSTSGNAKAGDVVGCIDNVGYLRIGVGGQRHRSHRLAWLYVHGRWPSGQVDHINGVRTDNRIVNLRDVSHAVNKQNERTARRNNKNCGLLGVSKEMRRNSWFARIYFEGKTMHLGSFSTPEAAHSAYLDAKRKYHPGCTI